MAGLEAHFNVHPSVVFKLGQDLITDEIQALAELIKNSYDADATRVVVRVLTEESPPEFPRDRGYLEVEDDGTGMDLTTLISGWLTISNSMKRDMKSGGLKTDKGRTPMGDKGLGRLGAQRLGSRLSIVTTKDGQRHQMTFDWRDFENKSSLNDVPIEIESFPSSGKPGTIIMISDLYDPESLQELNDLRNNLAKVISPYGEVDGFRLYLSVDGESLHLGGIDAKIRDACAVRYHLRFEDSKLTIRAQMRLAQLRPNSKKDREDWAKIVEQDRGEGLLQYLMAQPQSAVWRIRPSRSVKWWLELSHDIDLHDIAPRLVDGRPANPGSFFGEVDSFNLSSGSVQEVGVFDKASELRDLLREMHGIRIYRDGFNVRVADDWLGLGKQVTSGGSWYGLRLGTTMGFIAISAGANAQLTETTDREGFNVTPAYGAFKALLDAFVLESAKALEFIGRGTVDYRRQFDVPDDGSREDPESLLQNLSNTLTRAVDYLEPLQDVRLQLEAEAAGANALIDRYARVDGQPAEVAMLEGLNKLSRQAGRAGEMVTQLEDFITEVGRQRGSASRLQANLEMLNEQLTLTYETMAVGLTAEALAHEIGNIAERLARRSTEVARYIKKVAPDDRRLNNYVETVRGTVAGLRRQLAHLAPSLRYVRERREQLNIGELAGDVKSYFETRWADKIGFDIVTLEDFTVLMNRGKLLQVFDNIILNSEYWLNEDVRLGSLENAAVTVTINAPFVQIEDNGRGIDPQVEDALFEAFISKKPRGAGRGLGLFIVRQLLDAEGCEIELLLTRNKAARRFIFNVDLSSVLADA